MQHVLQLLLAAAAADAFLFGGGGGGCGCKPACPAPPPCPPPLPPRPCQCGCPKPLPPPPPPPPSPCGCGAAAAATSYASAPAAYATSGGNVARDDNITTFAGSYGGSNDSSEKERPSETKLPELSVPSKYTTYDEFARFLSAANNEDFSEVDKETGISASTALRRSAGFRRHREAEWRRRKERRRTEASRCPNRRLRMMIEEAIWDDGPSAAKYRLLRSTKQHLRRPFDIICSEGNFSYFIGNSNFCEYRARGVVCLMFEH